MFRCVLLSAVNIMAAESGAAAFDDADAFSLLQLKAQKYEEFSLDTTVSNGTVSQQNADMLEYLSSFRPCATCKKEVLVGSAEDGGYVMCEELLSEQHVTGAYSFGIEERDDWGADISTRLGVTVHQADCYSTNKPPCPAGKTCNFDFQPVCVGQNFEKGSDKPFETLQQQLQAESGSGDLVLKIDVEGSEWAMFANPENKPLLKRFSQIIAEFHDTDQKSPSARPLQKSGLEGQQEMRQQAMRNLMEDFVVVHLHQNNCCHMYQVGEFRIGNLVELTLVRRDLIEVGTCDPDPPQGSFKNVKTLDDLLPAHLPGGTQQ